MKKAVILPFIFLVAACSSLEVKVSIADPSIGRAALAQFRLVADLPPVLAQTSIEIERRLNQLTKDHHAIWRGIREEYERQAKAATTADQKSELSALAASLTDDIFEEDVSRAYAARKGVLIGITNELRRLCPTAGGGAAENAERVTGLLRQYREHFASLLAFQHADISSKTADPRLPDTLRAEGIKAQVAAEHSVNSLIGNAGLQGSPEAYAVISAPKDKWHERFDLSKALGRLGDLNVAIKMERRGNFTIKGV